jgi:signal transduction histidine kinase
MVKARDEFLSVAAHELKTPLTSLRLAGQTLLRRLEEGRTLDPASLERSLRTVDRQINRMTLLVAHLLDTVRLQAGTLQLERSLVNLVDLVSPVVEQIQGQNVMHELVLQAPAELWADIDPMRFEQIVVNLIDNAVKFSPSGGRIDVELEQVELDTIRFAVRDHGIGVPEEHRSQLFTRFYQAHGREHRSGMGLGLYICREIAEMHDGTIRAEFPNDGGTRVVLEIPAGSHGSADGSTEQPIGTAEAVASQQPSTG